MISELTLTQFTVVKSPGEQLRLKPNCLMYANKKIRRYMIANDKTINQI